MEVVNKKHWMIITTFPHLQLVVILFLGVILISFWVYLNQTSFPLPASVKNISVATL